MKRPLPAMAHFTFKDDFELTWLAFLGRKEWRKNCFCEIEEKFSTLVVGKVNGEEIKEAIFETLCDSRILKKTVVCFLITGKKEILIYR